MKDLPLRILQYPASKSPREWGRMHGELYRDEIAELAAIRLGLAVRFGERLFTGDKQVLEVADAHLPFLKAADRPLYDEVMGIAEGADCDPAMIVLINHYTDLRDIDPGANPPDALVHPSGSDGDDEDTDGGCTVVYAPGTEGRLLGQTWDTHASAANYLLLLGVPEHEVDGVKVPPAWYLSITGCVGMAGLNNRGVGLTINNLKSKDAKYGVIWPAIVRKALRQQSARGAADVVANSRVGSGHTYIIAGDDAAIAFETSGHKLAVVLDDDTRTYHHTNHCMNEEVAEVSWATDTSTTWARYDAMGASIAARDITTIHDLWDRLGEPPVGQHLDVTRPNSIGTCSTVAFNLTQRRGMATPGPTRDGSPTEFGFDGDVLLHGVT